MLILQTSAQTRKAPAYPLITHNPNFSIWSMTDQLNSSVTAHWTGSNHSLLGLIEVDGKTYRFMGDDLPNYAPICPSSDEENYAVYYTEVSPKGNWKNLKYDAADWSTGQAPISDNANTANTLWTSDEIWVRRIFEVQDRDQFNEIFLKLNHDDDIHVYLNGELIYSKVGWTNDFQYLPLSTDHQKLLVNGKNILAIQLKNTAGGRFLDFGLVDKRPVQHTVIPAKQTNVDVHATRTVYDFACGPIDLKLTFLSPLLMDDLDLLARPISYLIYDVVANDGRTHDVKILLSASSDIAVYQPHQEVLAEKYENSGFSVLKAGTTEQPILEKAADDMRIDWGHFYVSTPISDRYRQYISHQKDMEHWFTDTPSTPTSKQGKSLALNTVLTLHNVGKSSVEDYMMLGYDEIYAIQYFGENLHPWWNRRGDARIEDQFVRAAQEFASIRTKCEAFDASLYAKVLKSGGPEYAHLCVLAYRQSIAAHTLVESPAKEVLWLSKENNSGGFINTVDVTYPSSPLYLYYNPVLLQGMLNGIFYFTESGKYPYRWAAHDLGTYPLANGQTYGEPMPVEESGNMIILTAAIAKAEQNAEYAKKHWKTLTTWADYLTEEGLDPATQLCTDDFAGHLARNANLSVKAIVGIACYAELAKMLGHTTEAEKYRSIAEGMVIQWMEMADAGDHYGLTFDDPKTWSQKYNLVWDKVLQLNLFPEEVYKKEIKYYLTKQNRYGLPLDSRKSYTKNDWITWTATITDNDHDFQSLIRPIYNWAIETKSRVPMNDFYDTKTGIRENFKARSVVGGFYMKMFADYLQSREN